MKITDNTYMASIQNYKSPLSESHTLEVFQSNKLIFFSSGKWLNPLFDFQNFLKENPQVHYTLSVHDTAIGKAAAVILIKIGVKAIHGNIVSRLAMECIQSFNETASPQSKIELSWNTLVDKLMCATEAELADYSGSNEDDINQMYFLVRQRARLVLGLPLVAESISYSFGNIHNLSFSIKAGGHLMIIGENGAGKSTLLKLLAGVYKPLEGKIKIDDKQISKLPKYTIGYVPQFNENTEYSLSVSEVVGLGLNLGLCKKKKKYEIIRKSLERTSSLHLLNRSFSDLSGGEKQKVSLARCLAQNAKILLLDEPTASLDNENRKMVIDIVKSLSITEIPTIIIATHDKELYSLPGWNILNLNNNDLNNS